MKVLSIKKKEGTRLAGGTLPDIDTDFEGKRRSDIKDYMEERFGKKQVCSVGTHTTMKPKGIIKDFDRQFDNDYRRANLITSILEDSDESMEEIFRRACAEPQLRDYIQSNSDIFHYMPLILHQPKNKSIHSCAMIIFPDIMKAEEWVPVRAQQGLIVSEWGGEEMDEAGFLKEDILGIKQLDKFADILKLIKQNHGEIPNLYEIPTDDSEVFRYFSNGWNGDTFQFGTEGLTDYCRSLKPRSLGDLIAAVALYRPGPMENHYHEIYVKCKNEGRMPNYLWGTEEITRDTYGLVIFQESVMQICQRLGGLSMREADDVRKAMGKKKLDVLQKWEERIRAGFKKIGASDEAFDETWKVMVEFAKYSFNKSHAAAYAKTGYISQWLKVHYPLEYWTVALDYADEKKISLYLSEIFQAKDINIFPPDVNKSSETTVSDFESKGIYWGFASIKGIGDIAAKQIEDIRNSAGKYTSLIDFLKKNKFKGSKVNKTSIEALITCGAFDKIHNLTDPSSRMHLLQEFRDHNKVKVIAEKDKYNNANIDKSWWWLLKQKELIGLVFVDYSEMLDASESYASIMEINQPQESAIRRLYGGYVVEVMERSGKRGRFAKLLIESNYKVMTVMVWNEEYERLKKKVRSCAKSFIVFSGLLRYEGKWSKGNQFTLDSKSVFEVFK